MNPRLVFGSVACLMLMWAMFLFSMIEWDTAPGAFILLTIGLAGFFTGAAVALILYTARNHR